PGASGPEHVPSDAAGLGRGACAPVEGDRQPALGVRERHIHLVTRSSRLSKTAERLLELVLPELDLQRTDDGDGNDRRTGEHLLRLDEGRQVDRRHVAVESERLLPLADRRGIVLAWPTLQRDVASLRAEVADNVRRWLRAGSS